MTGWREGLPLVGQQQLMSSLDCCIGHNSLSREYTKSRHLQYRTTGAQQSAFTPVAALYKIKRGHMCSSTVDVDILQTFEPYCTYLLTF